MRDAMEADLASQTLEGEANLIRAFGGPDAMEEDEDNLFNLVPAIPSRENAPTFKSNAPGDGSAPPDEEILRHVTLLDYGFATPMSPPSEIVIHPQAVSYGLSFGGGQDTVDKRIRTLD